MRCVALGRPGRLARDGWSWSRSSLGLDASRGFDVPELVHATCDEPLAQLFSGARKPRFDRADRNALDCGDLVLGESLDLEQHDRAAKFEGQSVQSLV